MIDPVVGPMQVTQEAKSDLSMPSAAAFLEELAKDQPARLRMARSSDDGYPCRIYRTKSDCDWHPPCHWTGAFCG